jgi:hypothetical protein
MVGVLVAGEMVALFTARGYAGGPVFVVPLVAAFSMASARGRRRTIPTVVAAPAARLVTGDVSGINSLATTRPVVDLPQPD